MRRLSTHSLRASAPSSPAPDSPSDASGRGSVRTCAGCRQADLAARLLRLVHVSGHDPEVVPNLTGKLGGRGIWLHARRTCLVAACRKGGFARSLRQPVRIEIETLRSLLVGQLEARGMGLLSSAMRARAAALGTDAVREALTTGAARLLVVANDAAGRRDELCELAERRGCPFVELFDKASLGRLAGRDSLGIMAVSDAAMAKEIGTCARQVTGLAEGE